MITVNNRFTAWLLSLTLLLRCLVIALLVHGVILLSIGAIKIGDVITRHPWRPTDVIVEREDSTLTDPDVRFHNPIEKPFGPTDSKDQNAGGGPLASGSPMPLGDPHLIPTIGVPTEYANISHVRYVGNVLDRVATPGSKDGSILKSGFGHAGNGFGNGMGWRPGIDGRGNPPTQPPPLETERAVLAGLRWLKANQNDDGSWDCRPSKSAGTALAVLAFLGHGETPESKEFGLNVQRGLQYLLACVDEAGLVKDKNMYAQGVVTLSLAEGYALTQAPAIKEVLQRAVNAVLLSQKAAKKRTEHVGGWRYTASSADADTSVSGWMIMALKSAQLAGLDVPKDSFEMATRYLWNMYDDNGGFGYTAGKRSPNMTGIGVLCQQFLGQGRDVRLRKALDYLATYKMSWDEADGNWVLYGWYYTTQAMFQAGGTHWTNWEKQLRHTMVKAQASDGHWAPPPNSKNESGPGPAYTTALSCLILEVYYRYLPIYQEMEKRPAASQTASAR